jgi:hypothetical protein
MSVQKATSLDGPGEGYRVCKARRPAAGVTHVPVATDGDLLPPDAALAALAGLMLRYPEREAMIRQMVRELEGTDIAQIEWIVSERIKEIEPQILE